MVVEVLAAGLVLLAGTFVLVAVRRRLLQRLGGTVELSVRVEPARPGRGWVLGVGRFVDDQLQWYRVFSLAPRARRRFSRRELQVLRQRPPARQEAYALLPGAVVMECRTPDGLVQLGLDPSAVTGFLAWLEARPPGATLPG